MINIKRLALAVLLLLFTKLNSLASILAKPLRMDEGNILKNVKHHAAIQLGQVAGCNGADNDDDAGSAMASWRRVASERVF